MGDWLLQGARQLNIKEATLDVLSVKIEPKELELRPLMVNLQSLRETVNKELRKNGFPSDFFVEAKIRIEFLNPNVYQRTFYCYPLLIDKEGRKYQTGRMIEGGYEPDFNPFDEHNLKLPDTPAYSVVEKPTLMQRLLNILR